MMKKFLIAILLLSYSVLGQCYTQAATGIGGVAQNLLDPVTALSSMVGSACILIGFSFLVASIIKYMEHRRSPLMVPISTVVYLVIMGIALIVLPLAYLITENGIPYPFFKLLH